MVFKRKFFLDLSGGEAEATPAVVAPVRQAPPAPAKGAAVANAGAAVPAAASAPQAAASAPQAASSGSATAPAPAAGAPSASGASPTTAEAIAAELAAAQANRPAPSLATFAPDCVTAGAGLPQRRRRAGANLAGFKAMAQGMMKS